MHPSRQWSVPAPRGAAHAARRAFSHRVGPDGYDVITLEAVEVAEAASPEADPDDYDVITLTEAVEVAAP